MSRWDRRNEQGRFAPRTAPPTAEDVTTRFWAKVDQSDGCWNWTASVNNWGYGKFYPNKYTTVSAHRYSWELANGTVPEGLCVLHACDNPPCVNPAHLWVGTQADNMRDKVAKGRHHWAAGGTA